MKISGDSWLTIYQDKKKGYNPNISIYSTVPNRYKPGDIYTIKVPRVSMWSDSMHIIDVIIPKNINSGRFINIKTPPQRYIEEYEEYYFNQLKEPLVRFSERSFG